MGQYVNQCQTSGNYLIACERDMTDIGDEYFALEILENKENALR